MDLPDYLAARTSLAALMDGHQTQHRCTNGAYYGPSQAADCPVRSHAATILETLLTAETIAHTTCHTPAAVLAVAQAMVLDVDTGAVIPMTTLDAFQAGWWITKARLAMEAHAALLDPSVTP